MTGKERKKSDAHENKTNNNWADVGPQKNAERGWRRAPARPRSLPAPDTHSLPQMFHDLALPALRDAFAARDRAAAAAQLGYSVVAVEVEASGRAEDV